MEASRSESGMVRVAGQAPFDERGQVVGKGDFVAQFSRVMRNLKTAVEAAGGQPKDYAELTIYVTKLEAYWDHKKPLGAACRAIFGKYFPAITLVEVSRLYNPDCMIEISGVAIIG
jgi:enamine deaminase RidA (YjgF/YER057c/UK114 family)